MSGAPAAPDAPARGIVRPLVLLASVVACLLAVYLSPLHVPSAVERLRAFCDASGAWSPVVFTLVCVAGVACGVPRLAFAAVAGLLYGWALGFALAHLGSTTGNLLAFCWSRWLGRDFVRRHAGRRLARLLDRIRRQVAVARVRHEVVQAIRDFFYRDGFTLVDTPILTGSIGEEAGNLFSTAYFDLGQAYLAQTGQLYGKAAAAALGKIYCFGPTFRAEKSKTRRHLTEFWMVEPEVAFNDSDDNMRLQERFVSYIVARALEARAEDLKELERDTAPLERVLGVLAAAVFAVAVAAGGTQTPDGCHGPGAQCHRPDERAVRDPEKRRQ
jgi:hypothetical protein